MVLIINYLYGFKLSKKNIYFLNFLQNMQIVFMIAKRFQLKRKVKIINSNQAEKVFSR